MPHQQKNKMKITAEAIVAAIAKNDYELINATFDQRLLNPNEKFNGKPLLIHAYRSRQCRNGTSID